MFKNSLVTMLMISTVIALFNTGCAKKALVIKAVQPAEVGEMANYKKVAVVEFKNDKVGMSSKVEAGLASTKLDKKKYFTVVNRSQLNKVLKEQKLQHTELLSAETASKIGKLVGAEVLISGETTSNASSDSYMEAREKCIASDKKGNCVQIKNYNVKCNTTAADVSGTFNVTNVEQGIVVHAETITKTYNGDTCKDGRKSYGILTTSSGDVKILSESQAVTRLADQIAQEFTVKLAPRYIHFKVELMEKLDLEDPSKVQKIKFESALKFVEHGRVKKAETLFNSLRKDVNGKSIAVTYNLAVTNEAQGKFEAALVLYKKADEMSMEPNKLINYALTRVEKNIQNKKEATQQINK